MKTSLAASLSDACACWMRDGDITDDGIPMLVQLIDTALHHWRFVAAGKSPLHTQGVMRFTRMFQAWRRAAEDALNIPLADRRLFFAVAYMDAADASGIPQSSTPHEGN